MEAILQALAMVANLQALTMEAILQAEATHLVKAMVVDQIPRSLCAFLPRLVSSQLQLHAFLYEMHERLDPIEPVLQPLLFPL